MEKKWKNLLIITIVLLLFSAAFFLLSGTPPQQQSKTRITLEQGVDEISSALLANNSSIEKLKKAEIILIEDGQIKNDFSEQEFEKLKNALLNLKSEFAGKNASPDRDALIESIDIFLQILDHEKQEKTLFGRAVLLSQKTNDFLSGCRNKNEFVFIAQKEIELNNIVSELNQKANDFFLKFVDIERIDLLTPDLDPAEETEDNLEFLLDSNDIDYLCSIITDPEATQ